MLISVAVGGAGIVTVLFAAAVLILSRRFQAEQVFPEEKPAWLTGLTWIYLTFAAAGWIGFLENREPMPLLAAGMTTLAASKMVFVFLSYYEFRSIGRALWSARRALAIMMISSLFVGILMIYVASIVR